MITDAGRARICEAMGDHWSIDGMMARGYWHHDDECNEAFFVLAVLKHFRISVQPTDGWVAHKLSDDVLTVADTPEQAILLAALAVLDAKKGE